MRETRLLPKTEAYLLRRYLPDGIRIDLWLLAKTIGETTFVSARYRYKSFLIAIDYEVGAEPFYALLESFDEADEGDLEKVDSMLSVMNEHHTEIEVRIEKELRE